MDKHKTSYEQLEAENKQLKEQLDNIEKSKQFQKKAAKWTLRKGAGVFLGKGLKSAIKEMITEFNTEKKISIDTASNLGAHIIWRLTRIGIFAIVVAILPTLFLIIQTVYLGKQNDKIDKQNELITNQNARLEQQTYLQEAGRRSSLIFLMNNVLDKMDEELKDSMNKNRNLSDQLIGRIIALSKSLKPYKYLENDSLSMTVSPERGQLLVNLTKAKLSNQTYEKFFENADFSYSEISNMTFNGISFGNLNLSFSNLTKVTFEKCNFSYLDLVKSASVDLKFRDCSAEEINLQNSYIESILFYNLSSEYLRIDLSFVDFFLMKDSVVGYLSFYESYFDEIFSFSQNVIVKFDFILNKGDLKSFFRKYNIEKYHLWQSYSKIDVIYNQYKFEKSVIYNVEVSENIAHYFTDNQNQFKSIMFNKFHIMTNSNTEKFKDFFIDKNITYSIEPSGITFLDSNPLNVKRKAYAESLSEEDSLALFTSNLQSYELKKFLKKYNEYQKGSEKSKITDIGSNKYFSSRIQYEIFKQQQKTLKN
ncbi:MAG: hypothetical protein AAF611_13235 [Bacteroidota bacterium]